MQTMTLTRALILLVILSLATTILTHWVPSAGPYFVAAVLVLSGLKARVILLDYLGLRLAPNFRGGHSAFERVLFKWAF